MRFLRKLFTVGAVVVLLLSMGAAARSDTSITTSNSTNDADANTGTASTDNSAAGFTGQSAGAQRVDAADVQSGQAANVQEGDNEADVDQDSSAESGDAVGGQVIGAVTDGDLTVDATNSSTDVDVESGDATGDADAAMFVGLFAGSASAVGAADITNADAANVQEGDNRRRVGQAVSASSGDAVAGQVFGGVATGTTDAVLSNLSEDNDVTSGDSDENADLSGFTGLNATGLIEVI